MRRRPAWHILGPGEWGGIIVRPVKTMRLRFNLQAIPVALAALGLWAVIGGWYIAVAPAGLSGPDNIGIVLSTFGVCLFLADRLAFRWLGVDCWVIFFTLWFWGLIFIAWGLVEWLRAYQNGSGLVFTLHWLATIAILAGAWLLSRRSAADAPRRRARESTGPISLR